ncbi:phosphoadenosine phosphosulfate reductase family protein [Burkholderia cenocepacia]|uniref:phosphoadenosine phosphosulfate reductase domain-containing protein n=1 Tax=Burkholderia cenocepacia TaxID=95486 RepID=UPI0020A0F35F|nr:phosphoadenosine phosphosulfate reductase family protein [Burkholderia cenocepacia]MCO8321948.1 phosphoadenosine phosphosulfate reductase family protein [Burkholderia cenocepacia]MCO8329232.1 phosphoadenosine phosphosulfate reductase family protein [Burkholderia cenocepacia]MCO8336647.1 phosphoadenosine phosphosulfate reductase family protein [Burkholderia cenocepacia]MCO8343932.1 phosphoadenosine phosphosulfate reductase family protein [Burkholderia cenocepacia]MCO8357085.1 phosphoadenosin
MMDRPTLHVVSLSGGKDSTATLLVALELHGRENVRAVFADTGNEHESTYEYALEYLPRALGITVDVVRADFTDEFATKRANLARIAAGEPESAVYGKREFMYAWTPAAAARALDLLHPTGNPFLDLCMVRGGFPSRKRQFCTEYLKRNPLTEYAIGLIDEGYFVESWQGVRADESEARRWLPHYEWRGGYYAVFRPILRWNVSDVFAAHAAAGIAANPLYREGMTRVGCMPCINAGKLELREIARRFPEHVERIAAWERLVSEVCRPLSPVSFFHMGTTGHSGQATTVHQVVEWSKTTRGGRQYDLLADADPATACASAYGLCE